MSINVTLCWLQCFDAVVYVAGLIFGLNILKGEASHTRYINMWTATDPRLSAVGLQVTEVVNPAVDYH